MPQLYSLAPARRRMAPLVLALSLVGAVAPSLAAQRTRPTVAPAGPAIDSAAWASLRWRHIGPEGNRVTSVAGVAGDRTTYYAGAASGGLWKTSDGGNSWQPVFDDQPVSSIGSLATAPSDPNVVWAGTGEPFIRSHISIGWGVWRSTDAGKSFTRMGLEQTGRIARIVVHPTNPDLVYVASLGHSYGPQAERGIYRTTDGGKSWEKVLFVNDSTGASDLVMDPNNPRILFAGMWQVQLNTWGRFSGGAGSGIWMSRDGGTTWKRLTGNGLPTTPMGKIGLAMSKANSSRVYALIEAGDGLPAVNVADTTTRGRLWRSDDGGTTWQVVSYDQQVAGRTHYYNRMTAMPDNADEAYFLTANWAKTLDGGKTILDPPFKEVPAGDHHDVWVDPTNGHRMIVSHDGGVSITENRGKSWRRIQLPIAQMYHVAVDNRIPYNVYGNRQDGPSTRGPSNSKMGDYGITRGAWSSVGGGESGWAQPDPVDTNLVWSSASGYGSVGGIVSRWDLRSNQSTPVEVWPQGTIGHAADEVKYRFVWTFPVTISPHDHNKLYVGSQHVHVTTNGGRSWQVISPDLSRNDRARMVRSGGLTPDNIGVEYSGVVFAIAESPRTAGVIWAGTNDGKLHLTRDGGANWTDLSANLPGAPTWGTISNIEASRYDDGTAWLSIDAHQANNRDPFIYKTTDFGKTWTLLVNGIPKSPLSYVHVVREDPVRRGLLYAGTENGIYVSLDDGARWQPLNNNLPHAPVYWIEVQPHFSDLVIATYGRGFWIMDDISPLRALAPQLKAQGAALFAPRPAYRFLPVEVPFADYDDPVTGTNPPYGAALNVWLADAVKDSLVLSIADASGLVVRRLASMGKPGVNRIWWDLRNEPTKEAKLRTENPYAPDVRYPPEGRAAPGVGRFNMLVPPGRYTVTLTVGAHSSSQPLEVRKDPVSGGSEGEIRQQVETARDIARDIDAVVDMVNTLEIVRGQAATIKASLGDDSTMADVRVRADSLDKAMRAVEELLVQLRVTGRGQDLVRYPFRLSEQLIYLGQSVTSSDFAPTEPQRQVQAVLKEQLRQARARFDAVMAGDLEAFRQLLRARNVKNALIS
ncbi:MAG: sialidase [Gemmatimonadetes bacterium]|nr:sialidase [Gemmatimonadota bacterium]